MVSCSCRSVLLLNLLLLTVNGVPAGLRQPGEDQSHDLENGEVRAHTAPPHTRTFATDEDVLDDGEDLPWSDLGTLAGSIEMEDKGDLLQRFRLEAARNWQVVIGSYLQGHHRQRRAHALPTKLTRDPTGYWTLTGLNKDVNAKLRNFAPPPRAASMVMVEHAGRVFWLVTQDYTLQDPGSLHVYMLVSDVLESTSVPTLGANHCQPVLLRSTFIEVVCVETLADRFPAEKRIGSGVYRVTWADGLQVVFKRGLQTYGAQDVAIWNVGGFTFLAFANSYNFARQTGEINSVVFRVKVTAMSEEEVYSSYDRLDSASVPTKHAMGVEAFEIQSRRFLAVANHQDDQGNVDIDSQIFVYDVERSRFQSFQRIRTSGARDWTAFSFVSGPDAEYFLAVANEYSLDEGGHKNYAVDSVIYRYEENKFVPFQCVQTYGALHWAAYQGPNGEFLLAVVNSQEGVFFYQYNGWTFVRSNLRASSAGVERVWMGRLPTTLDQVVITVANPFHLDNRPLVLYTEWQYHNPLSVYHRESLEWCESFKAIVAGDDLGRLLEQAASCTRTNETYVFTRPVTIDSDLTVSSPTLVSQVDPIYVDSDGIFVSHSFTIDVVRAFARLSEIVELQDGAQRRYDNAKKIHQPNLDGHTFSNLKVECRSRGGTGSLCSVKNLVVEKINDLDATFDNAIWLTRNNGVLNQSFADVAVTKGASAKVAFLSGPDLALTPTSDLVTLTGTHIITGEKTFFSLRANTILVSGTVDGVVVDERTLLLTIGEQRVTGIVTVESLDSPHIFVNLLNGQSFTQFYNDLVLNDVSQLWTGLVRVGRDLVAPAVFSTGMVTPLDPEVVLNQALLHTTPATQIVTGLHTIEHLEVEGELTVLGGVNGVRFPEDIFLRSGPEVVVHTPTTFLSVAADNIFILSNLNHIQNVDGRLAVLLLETDQVVTHKKIFTDFHILGHSSVGQKVAGYDLEDLTTNLEEEFVLGINSGREIDGSLTFHDALHVADDTLDGASLRRIVEAAVPLTATNINLPLIFQGSVQVDGDFVITDTLNGEPVDSYVLTHGSYTFTDAITFKDGLRVEGDVTTGTMEPYDVSQLASQLVQRNRNQTIHQDVYFLQPVMADLHVNGIVQINGVNLDDLVTLSGTTVITGRKTFTQVRVLTDVNMGAVRMGHCGLVDGVIIDELFFTDTLRKNPSSTQTLTGRYVQTLVASSATGTDLGIFERTVVYTDATEYIDGSLNFTGTVTVDVLTFGKDFDGVSGEDYHSGWLLKEGDQTLMGRNTLFDAKAGAVTFDGTYLQTVDWNRLLHMTAKVNEPTTVQTASFGLLHAREITLTGTIQGWDLSVHALTASAEAQKITGRKTFLRVVVFSGKFDMLKGLVVRNTPQDDPLHIDLRSFFDALALDPSTIHINSLTIRGNVIFGDDVRISGHLNGEDATTLTEEFWLSDLPASISSVASLNTVILSPGVDLQLKALINGVDVETLWDAVLKQECEGTQVVSAAFTIDSLAATRLHTYVVNTPDDQLARDLDNLLLTDGRQTLTGVLTMQELTAQASMQLNGTVNGLRVDEDLVRRGQAASITGRKIFQRDVTVVGDLNPLPLSEVQGVDVSEFAKSVVVNGGRDIHTIPGVTTFRGLRILGPLTVGGRVDGVLLTRATVLLTTGQQTMSGALRVAAAVPHRLALTAHGGITVQDNYFNDVDLRRLNASTVRTYGAIVVTGAVVFREVVKLTDVWLGNHLINGYNLTDLALCLLGQHVLDNMGNKLAAIQQAALDIQDVVTGRVQDLWYYKRQNLSRPLHRLQPVRLEGTTVNALVGLDRSEGLVRTYNISSLVELYPPIRVEEPRAAAGLAGGLLAVCGVSGLSAAPQHLLLTPTYTKVGSRGSGYGHVYQLGDTVRLEAAFGVTECRDLVSFSVGSRQCLAVVDYRSTSFVMCRSSGGSFILMNFLDTRRAVKGAWLEVRDVPYLLVAEEATTTQPADLKVFRYDDFEDQMVMIHHQVMSGASWVSAVRRGSGGLVAVTRRHTTQLVGQVVVLEATPTTASLSFHALQDLHVEGVVQSSLSLMPTGEVVLYVQTRRNLLLYLLKGASFIFYREIGTTPALHPLSFPFLDEVSNTAMVAYTGAGLLQMYEDLPTLQLATPTLYTSVYKPLYAQ